MSSLIIVTESYLPVVRISSRNNGSRAVTTCCRDQLSERPRLHPRHGYKYLSGQSHLKPALDTNTPVKMATPITLFQGRENAALYKKYEALAAACPDVHFVGRLATYKYYNMDQVVAQALTLCAKLTGVNRGELIERPSADRQIDEVLTSAKS